MGGFCRCISEHTKLISPYPSVPYKRRNVDLAVHVLGTCKGIVCFIHLQFCQKDAIVIWNPCIRRFVDLPNPRKGNLELEKMDTVKLWLWLKLNELI